MTLRMVDSINPASLPGGFDAYCGYDNGNWADYQAIAKAHPTAYLLDMTVLLSNTGTGGDFEPGDMTPPEAVTWVTERTKAGDYRPVVYASIAGYMPQIVADLAAAGFTWPASYRRWSAHYGAGKHICGPFTCKSPIQCDGTQWINHGNYDESLLDSNFFVAVPAPSPAPIPTPPSPGGDDVPQVVVEDVVSGGSWVVTLPNGAIYAQDGAPGIPGMNAHPGLADGPIVGAAYWPGDGTPGGGLGISIVAQPPSPNASGNPYSTYHFNRLGQPH